MSRSRHGLTHETVRGMLWTAWGKGSNALLELLVLVILARLLRPADFGVVSAALVMLRFSTIFSQLGLGPAIVQRPVLERRHLDTAFTVSVLFGLVLAALLWLGAPFVGALMRLPDVVPVLRVLAWIFPLRGLAVVSEARLQRDLQFSRLANIEVATLAIGYAPVGILLAMQGWGVWALVAAYMTQGVLKTATLLALRPPTLVPVPERRALSELLYFGGGFTAAKIANYFALEGDNLIVGRWLGAAALGVYSRAFQLMATPAVLLGQLLDTVLFPALARVQTDPARLALAYRRAVTLIALFILPMSAAMCALAPELIGTLLGPKWTAVVAPFQLFTVGILFRTSYKVSDSLARAVGAVYRRAWRQAIYAGLVIGGAWFGQRWGVPGVAAGVLVALTTNFVLMAHLSLSLSGLSWRALWAAHASPLVLGLVVGAACWGTAGALRLVAAPSIVVLALGTMAGLGAGAAALWLAPRQLLGADAQWMLGVLRAYIPVGRRPGLAGSGARAVAEPSLAGREPADVAVGRVTG